jgi:hypothetical protein
VSFDVSYGWDIGDEWCLGNGWQSCVMVKKVRVHGVVTKPFLLPFANQIQDLSDRSFGKSFSASNLPNMLARISGNYVLSCPYVG